MARCVTFCFFSLFYFSVRIPALLAFNTTYFNVEIDLNKLNAAHLMDNVIVGKSKTLDLNDRHYYFFVSKDDFVSETMVATGGNWEENLNLMFKKLWEGSKSRGLVLDCGVNMGSFTMFAASLGAHIIGFEMQPYISVLVVMSLRLSGYLNRVHIFNNALWYKSGTNFSFSPHANNLGGTQVIQGYGGTSNVTTLRIDEVVPVDKQIFFMKMDLELSEPYALLGMNDLFNNGNIMHVVIECFEPLVLQVFFRLGYICRIFDNGGDCSWPNVGPSCHMHSYEDAMWLFKSRSPGKGRNRKSYMDVHCFLDKFTPLSLNLPEYQHFNGKAVHFNGDFFRIENRSFTPVMLSGDQITSALNVSFETLFLFHYRSL